MPLGPDQALTAALSLTGLGGTPTVAPASGFGERTPFVGRQMAALGPAWELTWQAFRMALPSARGAADRYARTVVVRVAQGNGQFLGATLRAGELPAGVRPTPDGEVAQDQLRRASESYAGLPAVPPRVSLVRALDAVLEQGVGSPLQASEIQALYVMHAQRNRPAIPAWVITLNGIPPLPHSGPEGAQVPVWQRNHLRNVVDAGTGRLLFATTVPQPTAALAVS
jgi:hypothetical protein